MKRWVAATTLMVLGLGLAWADGDPIKDRRDLMKTSGDAAKTVVGMLKGAPFDLAVVQAALKSYGDVATRAPALFPDSSRAGDTNALPAIWESKADFIARFAKLADDVNAASKAITDQASFQANMPGVLKNCGGCHELYSAKKT